MKENHYENYDKTVKTLFEVNSLVDINSCSLFVSWDSPSTFC